jgi:hypothetical protein
VPSADTRGLVFKSASLRIVRQLIDAFIALSSYLAPKVVRKTFGCEQMKCEVRCEMRADVMTLEAASQQPRLGNIIFAVDAKLVKLLRRHEVFKPYLKLAIQV